MAVEWSNIIGDKTLESGGYAGDLLQVALAHLASARDDNQLTDENVGEVYAATISSAIAQAVQFELQKDIQNKQADKIDEEIDLLQTQDNEMILNGISSRANKDENTAKLVIEKEVALATKQDKIDSSATALAITVGTKQYKIDAALYATNKANFDALYVQAQNTALKEQVIDNRKIKALDSLADTYGTFGAGGITLSADMWSTYFDLVVSLAGGSAPTSTTVSKVA